MMMMMMMADGVADSAARCRSGSVGYIFSYALFLTRTTRLFECVFFCNHEVTRRVSFHSVCSTNKNSQLGGRKTHPKSQSVFGTKRARYLFIYYAHRERQIRIQSERTSKEKTEA